jgi:O-acetyl-ADP-ribose deacetylase (regulator of RNase III)
MYQLKRCQGPEIEAKMSGAIMMKRGLSFGVLQWGASSIRSLALMEFIYYRIKTILSRHARQQEASSAPFPCNDLESAPHDESGYVLDTLWINFNTSYANTCVEITNGGGDEMDEKKRYYDSKENSRSMTSIVWTNPSVKQLAGNLDPITAIIKKTRAVILDAIDNGWQGPPFDPISLAQRLGLSIVPREDVLDARLIPGIDRKEIEYNPNRSRSRIRFSLAHEIAHTFFPDYSKSIHNRSTGIRNDEWQLELLCNISAAEILMPIGPYLDVEKYPVTIDKIIEIRNAFDVSTEAVLLRLVKLTIQPITVFAAANDKDDRDAPYRIDYVINSSSATIDLRPGMKIPPGSVLSECTAIGFTAKRKEKWLTDLPEFDVECIGVPPYPSNTYPRVLGIIRTRRKSVSEPSAIRYLVGDATEPRGIGHKIIAHIINDKSTNWGRGFGLVISKKWPAVRNNFHEWAKKDEQNLKLGNSHLFSVSESLSLFHMIAQQGYGPSTQPRIRYRALTTCLNSLLEASQELYATVHMPRIGTGYAGGNWAIISELIDENLIKRGVDVTVYDLPGREKPKMKKSVLDFGNNTLPA